MQYINLKELKKSVTPALQSKVKEFQMIGYKDITSELIWHSLLKNIWHHNPPKQLHKVMQDIMKFSAHTYMDFRQADALKFVETDLSQSIKALT